MSIVCVSEAYCIPLCHCGPKDIKNTLMSHTAALGYLFLHPEANGYSSLLRNGSKVEAL